MAGDVRLALAGDVRLALAGDTMPGREWDARSRARGDHRWRAHADCERLDRAALAGARDHAARFLERHGDALDGFERSLLGAIVGVR